MNTTKTTEMANITSKSSKQEMVDFITKSRVTEKSLKSRVAYTLKAFTKDVESVTKKDLYDLAKEVLSAIMPAKAQPVENSEKPKLLGKNKNKPEAKPETTPEAKPETKKEEKAPAPKIKSKKADEKPEKPTVKTTEGLTTKDMPIAKIFPKTLEHEALGTLVACPNKYKNIKEFAKAIEDGKQILFVCYWTKRHIKEFSYAQRFEVPTPKAGFPDDLDLLQVIYVCENIPRVYALSVYTEAMLKFFEEDLARTECKTNDGESFSMRYSAGLEYEIYEVQESK